MSFGGFCPGLRLRDDPKNGLRPEAQSRLALDVAAIRRAAPLAIAALKIESAGTAALVFYIGQDPGQVRPFISVDWNNSVAGVGIITLRWTKAAKGEDGFTTLPVRVNGARRTGRGTGKSWISSVTDDSVSVSVQISATTFPYTVDLKVLGSFGDTKTVWRDYGGHPEKRAASNEEIPYAYAHYDDVEAGLGNAFTTDRTGIVHLKKLVIARRLAGVSRARERAIANSIPGTSTDLLRLWSSILQVKVFAGDPDWLIRDRTERAFISINPLDFDELADECRAIIGDYFVDFEHIDTDDLENPPAGTFWPKGPVGSPVIDLGGGTWTTKRQHLVVRVKAPQSPGDNDFNLLMMQLTNMLTRRMPGTWTFNWAIEGSGFFLDQSWLGYDAL